MRIIIFFITILSFALTATASDYKYQAGKGIVFGWTSSDIIGVYTPSGTRIRHTIKELDSDNHFALVTGNGWGIAKDMNLYAYSPYSSAYYNNNNPITALPVSYSSQQQSANDNTDHLSAVDFQYSQFSTTASSADINFKHYGSIIRVAYTAPETRSFTSLSLNADESIFTTDAIMNLVDQTLIPTEKSNKLSLILNNISVNKGDILYAYLMIAPTDLSDKTITLSLTAADGTSSSIELEGISVLAGYTYEINLQQNTANAKLVLNTNKAAVIQLSPETPKITGIDFPISSITFQAVSHGILGDVNGDGRVMVNDAVLLINHYLGGTTSSLDKNICDVNKDGIINVADAVAIVNIFLNSK